MPRGKQGCDLVKQLGFVRHVEIQTDVIESQQFAERVHLRLTRSVC
jgi:hypothetical protein